jgi:hypothetical protein
MSSAIPTTPIKSSPIQSSDTPVTHKRPLTAFIRYRRALKKARNITNQAQQRSMWKALSSQEKQRYYDEYQIDLEEYKKGPRATRRTTPKKQENELQSVDMNPAVVPSFSKPISCLPEKVPDLPFMDEWYLNPQFLLDSSMQNSQCIPSTTMTSDIWNMSFFGQ